MKRALVLALVLIPGLVAAQTLTWSYPPTVVIDGFNLYRAPGPTCGTYTKIGSTAMLTLTYKDVTAQPGAAYCYRLTAYNANTESQPSNVLAFTKPLPPPTLVLIVAAIFTGPGAGGSVASTPAGILTTRDGTQQAPFPEGNVTLAAVPKANGSTFLGWGGACAPVGRAPTCTVLMTGDLTVTAEFTK